MYLCHITLLMFKDTKSLGNNKASAWESRGFVIKKEGMHFDTPSFILLEMGTAVSLLLSLSAFCSPKESRAALAASA
jgi:hypothetical protein